jgi:transcriptional regulator with XRE-family HTH domain
MPSVGDRLKFSRENKMVSQIKVYKDTGIHNKTLSGYERGVSEPDLETISVLAKYYGVSTDYLLGRTDYNINEINYVKKEQGRYISLIEDLTSLSEDSQEEIKKLIELYKIKEMQDRNKSKDIKSNKKLNKVY